MVSTNVTGKAVPALVKLWARLYPPLTSSATCFSTRWISRLRAWAATISTHRSMGSPEVRMMANWEQRMASSLSLMRWEPKLTPPSFCSGTASIFVTTEHVSRSWDTASNSS